MAESIPGGVADHWGPQDPMAEAGLPPQLLLGLDLGEFLASCLLLVPLPEPPFLASLRNRRLPHVPSVAPALLTWGGVVTLCFL